MTDKFGRLQIMKCSLQDLVSINATLSTKGDLCRSCGVKASTSCGACKTRPDTAVQFVFLLFSSRGNSLSFYASSAAGLPDERCALAIDSEEFSRNFLFTLVRSSRLENRRAPEAVWDHRAPPRAEPHVPHGDLKRFQMQFSQLSS